MTTDRTKTILQFLADRLPREPQEPADEYILRLGEEIEPLDKLIRILQQDLCNIAELSRRAGLRTPEFRQP